MLKNVLTSGGWYKEQAESQQIGGDKVRVYRRPDHNVKAAIKAIKEAVTQGREGIKLDNIENDIQYNLYLMRKGNSICLLMSKSERTEVHLPFFLMSKDVVKPLPTERPLPEFFDCWFAELKQVYILTQFFNLSAENQQKLFLYLAHRYHYNAPFSQEENTRLGYQTSPLAITERNSYLRSSQTIWMQLASQLTCQRLNATGEALSIIWIDHPNFVSFLNQFYPIEEVLSLTPDILETLVQRWQGNYEESSRPFYIFLKNIPGTSKERLIKAQEFAKEILEAITNKLTEIKNTQISQSLDDYFQTPLPEKLQEAAILILTKGVLGKKTEQYFIEEAKMFLKERYDEQLLRENQQWCEKIEISFESGEWPEDQIEFLWRLYTHPSHSFSSMPKLKQPAAMLEFLKNKTASQGFIEQLLAELRNPNFSQPADYLEAFRQEIVNQRLDDYFQAPLPSTLRKAVLLILTKGVLGKKTEQYFTGEAKIFLKERYDEQLSQKNEQWREKIKISYESGKWSKDRIEFLLGLYKHPSHSFLSMPKLEPHTAAAMLEFLKNKTASQGFIEQLLAELRNPNFSQPADYLEAFRQEIRNNILISQQDTKDIVGIFYVDSFEGLTALISPYEGEAMQNLVKVLGNLGYSPDAVHFLQILLQGYPAFFPEKQPSFLEALFETQLSIFKKSQKMQKIIASAFVELNTLNKMGKPLHFKNQYLAENIYSNFNSALRNLAAATHNAQNWFKLYSNFLIRLLRPILEVEKVDESSFFAIKTMTDYIQRALTNKDKIHLFIRAMQDVLEAWMLYINIHPLVKDPAQVFQNALRVPPTVVHFTPYAMRSFTRVLQALMPINSSDKSGRPRIQIFNQSYFELITNMERFRQTADILIAQSDAQLKECDVYFIDIHPNNAVEARLHPHKIVDILHSLARFPQNKPRTLVVDITLNALSDAEINTLLHAARPLIDTGQLNLVLIQSLTKFSQLGLDKLSAGFLAAYNNKSPLWQQFNDQLNSLQVQEPVDALTLQFFACLTHYAPSFQKNYIEQINQNTRELYHSVLKNYTNLNLPLSKKMLALTCNTDLNTCYLAFNSRGIFSLLDPAFNLSVEELGDFHKDIIEKLFIPLATWLNLPLTERMSIGFPLSSINECMHAIRLTVGLEKELLPKYADLITYICFTLNRERNPALFFKRIQDQAKVTYPEREKYFKEKVAIFEAMYPMPGKSAEPVRITEPLNSPPYTYREFVLNNGTIQVNYFRQQNQLGAPVHSRPQTLDEQNLYVHFALREHLPLADIRITPFIKRLLASCLTQRQNEESGNAHTVKFTFVNQAWQGFRNDFLSFTNFFYIREDNCSWTRFGDYKLAYNGASYQVSFDFKEQKLWLVLNQKFYDESTISIRKGHEILPAADLDMEEKWQFFKQSFNEPNSEVDFYRYKPASEDSITVKLDFNKGVPEVIIERDQLAFQLDGVSLYWQRESKKAVQLEIDFWGVKNPIHARFLCILFCYAALYKRNIPFVFVSESHNRMTLLEENYQPGIFRRIAEKILKQREKVGVQFDEKRLMQKDSPHGRRITDFWISDLDMPYPAFMETIYHDLLRE